MRHTLLLSLLLLAGCDSSSDGGSCYPPGFTACSGDDLVTCVQSPGEDAGVSMFTHCRDDGQFCSGGGLGAASCGPPHLGTPCQTRNALGCDESDMLLRCVWISEQPEPGFSGDIGIWRVQTDCTASSQVCPVRSAACAAP